MVLPRSLAISTICYAAATCLRFVACFFNSLWIRNLSPVTCMSKRGRLILDILADSLTVFVLNRLLRNAWYSLSPVSKALRSLHVTSVATICCVTVLCKGTFKDVITNGLCRD